MALVGVHDEPDGAVYPDDEEDPQMTQKLINEEYKTWKKNSPFLYDMILSTALEWPTLTVQWFPDTKDPPGKNYRVHRLLLGTHTAEGRPNNIQIAEVEIPRLSKPDVRDYDEDRGEIGGHGGRTAAGENPAMRFRVVQQIDHPGEVNKARYQPQNPDILATFAVDGNVLVFDRTQHPAQPTGTPNPQAILRGHESEGFGLNWNPHEQGFLVSGSEDKSVCVWDLRMMTTADSITPVRRFTHHTGIVNDVEYHPTIKHWFASVSDDMTFQIIDVRAPDSTRSALVARDGHSDAINALAFHPTQETLVVTGSGDKTIGVWDLRYVKVKMHTLESHKDAVTSLSWNPFDTAMLGSGGYDRRMLIWDLTRIGQEQTAEDAEDGPPELLFMHGGHTNHIADFGWSPNHPWLMCSAAEDNLLQIWKPAQAIIGSESMDVLLGEVERETS